MADFHRPRRVAREKSPQLISTATGAAPNGTVYDPVASYTNPARAGPSAAPHRHPSVSTPMIPPIARTPNTSGITFVIMVSDAAKPTPNSPRVASNASRDGTHGSAT